MTLAVAAVLATGTAAGVAASAAADPGPPWQPAREKSVPGTGVTVPAPEPDPAELRALTATPPVSWPAPGVADVRLDARTVAAGNAVAAGDLPVQIGPAGNAKSATATATPAQVRVGLPGRYADGLLLRLQRTDSVATEGQVSLRLDYSKFRDAYGGDWAVRLRVLALPECALSTPDVDGCRGTPLPTTNNGSGTLSADVTVPADRPGAREKDPDAGSALYAVLAAASSGAGDFKASSLSPSATWTVGGSAGEFAWSYPLDTPPALDGPEPELSLGYSSGSVDGRTSGTNNQVSWVGEGFELNPGGFIERRYKNCGIDIKADDRGRLPNNVINGKPHKTGDLCWGTDNATFSLNGRGGELIRDDTTGVWKPKADDGSTVEHLNLPADKPNGDDDREYWKITTRDGTKFYFGLHRLPSNTASSTVTNSVWTAPVFGNHPDEPCRKDGFDASFCPNQAWRWNLDYVVDPHGNTMSLHYKTETNNYARNLTATKVSNYIRGGWLDRIDYGQRDGEALTAPPVGRVNFIAADRCIPDTACTTAQPANWPDVPWDQACSSTTNCNNKFNPVFFTQKRLAKVTTQVWRGSALDDVDSWTFNQTFPDPQDGTKQRLWLNTISHKGHVGATDVNLPDVGFDAVPTPMPNRVDGIGDIVPPMNWMRIGVVRLDSGGRIAMTYSGKECAAPNNLPVPDNNTKRCHPMKWTPDGQTAERTDWFNKYVVTQVVESEVTTAAAAEVTQVEYASTPAWRHDDQDGLVPEEQKTWSQWRGYDKVRLRKGAAGGQQMLTESRFFRGMDGDKTTSGTPKDVWITDSAGGSKEDIDQFAGTERERSTYTNNGSSIQERSIHDPWLSGATARRQKRWGVTTAHHMEDAKVLQSEATPTGGWQNSGSDNEYNAQGTLLRSNDLNDLANPNDDTCTRYTYTSNEDVGIHEIPARVETVATSCDRAASYPDDVLADERIYYDNATTVGARPTKGDVTRTEEFNGWSNGAPNYVTTMQAKYDAYGRETEIVDIKGGRTTINYQPATGPVTRVTVTNALNHTTTTELEPAWGDDLAVTDANDRRTQKAYDGLGRLTKVWLPGRNAATDSPSSEYSYLVRPTGANVVTSRTLQPDGRYETEYELFDGQLRPRQTQEPAPGGGRIITDTIYDSRGTEVKHNGPYYNDAPPGTEILIPANEADLPAQHVTEYDDNDRPRVEIFKVHGAEKWRTTHTYTHNEHAIDPPPGETPTTRITDDDGRLIELRQYLGDSPTGGYDKTTYTYTKKGQLETVTDPAGNVWRNHYDVQGRLDSSEDPDRGVLTFTYNDADELISQTDARRGTLFHAYDVLGRSTALHEGSPTGPKRSEWRYDTAADGSPARGEQTSSSRFVNGNEYKISAAGFDSTGRSTGTVYTIPASEGRLANTYSFPTSYHPDGDLATVGLPAVAGLPGETLEYGYNANGLPTTLKGATPYVADTRYTPFGELSGVTLSAGGKWVNFGYDYEIGTRRLSRAVVQRENAPQKLADVGYRHDAAGNVTKVTDTPDPATGLAAETQCFRYDYLRRLTTAFTPRSSDCEANPTAAGLGGPAPYWHQWEFDKTGNRKKETRTEPNGAATTSTYSYPAAGQPQPHTVRSVTTTGPSGTRTDPYGYDATGNTTSRRHGTADQQLTWDAEGHLAEITENGQKTSFVYDADGDRLIRRDPGGTTLYLGETEVTLAANGTLSGIRYYSHGGRTIAVRTSAGNKLHWLALDHHGTPELAIDSSTQEALRRRFTPFGEERGAPPANWPGQKSFVGGTSDPSTGLIHIGAREYDPKAGRFLSVDPIIDYQDPQQTNGYAYANNSPVTYTDPDGKFGFSIKRIAKTVVQTVVKKVVQPVTNLVPYTVPYWVKVAWHGVTHTVKKVAHKVKKVTKHVTKKIKKTIKKTIHIVKKIKKVAKKGLSKAWKTAKRAAKAVGKAAKRAGKASWHGLKKAGAWSKRNLGPGSTAWNVVKTGAAVAGMFGCAACAAVATVMIGVDALIAASHGDITGVAMEAMSMVPGGKAAAAAGLGGVKWLPRVTKNFKSTKASYPSREAAHDAMMADRRLIRGSRCRGGCSEHPNSYHLDILNKKEQILMTRHYLAPGD